MTLLLDCDSIRTNQQLEWDQTANQLLERIGAHYWSQPITYLAQLCRLYHSLVQFSLSLFLSVFLAVGLFFPSYAFISVLPSLCLSFFFCRKKEKKDEILVKKEKELERRYKDKCFLSLWLTCHDSSRLIHRSLKTPWDYHSSLFLCTDVTGKEQSPSSLNISVLHTNTRMYTYAHTHTLNTDCSLHMTSPHSSVSVCVSFICSVSTLPTGQAEVTSASSFCHS